MGVATLNLKPYSDYHHVLVSFGVPDDEILQRMTINGPVYYGEAKNLKQIKSRYKSLKAMEEVVRESPFEENSNGRLAWSNELYKDCGWLLLRFKQKPDFTKMTPQEICEFSITVSHEVLHICQFFLTDYLDRNEEAEAEAYFHDNLMREILRIAAEQDYF